MSTVSDRGQADGRPIFTGGRSYSTVPEEPEVSELKNIIRTIDKASGAFVRRTISNILESGDLKNMLVVT